METHHIFYKLSCFSYPSKNIEQGSLTNNQIISNTFYIPYRSYQGVYDNNNVSFTINLFHNNIKIFECDLLFELFDDNIDESLLQKLKWKPLSIDNNYIEYYFENIECKDCYILEEKLIIMFDIDFTINGYVYEKIYGDGSYDWDENKPIILPNIKFGV
jgi:hypothetical protein